MFMSINSYQNLFDRLEDKFDACLADAAVHAMAGEDKARVFLLRVNYVGIATFVVSCVVDAKAVMAERWKDDAERERDAIEHELADLDCLELDPQKARVLHSLMRQKVLYDIEREKHDRHAERKGKWLDEWSRRITQTIGVEGDGYFLDGKSLYDEINGTVGAGNGEWLWLVALELVMFKPYFPLHGDNDKEYKSLKARSDYIGDVFCQKQTLIAAKELHGLGRGVKDMENRLDGAMARRLGGTACVVVAVAATGGLAFYLAPAVAPVLAAAFGFEAAGLYGAALTSASLAFLGGGSLIAGGAGMAGGTMLIVGGGVDGDGHEWRLRVGGMRETDRVLQGRDRQTVWRPRVRVWDQRRAQQADNRTRGKNRSGQTRHTRRWGGRGRRREGQSQKDAQDTQSQP